MLIDLRAAEAPGKRWEIIEYLVRDGRFEARYTYPEEINREEEDRRGRILKERFPDRHVVFPTWPEMREQQRALEQGLPAPPMALPGFTGG